MSDRNIRADRSLANTANLLAVEKEMMATKQARAVSIQTALGKMTLLHNVAEHQLVTAKKTSSALNILTAVLTQSGPYNKIQTI